MGQGYATKAMLLLLQYLKSNPIPDHDYIYARVYKKNAKSIYLHKKLGFKADFDIDKSDDPDIIILSY